MNLILGNEKFHKNEYSLIFQNRHCNYLTPSTIYDTIQSYCAKKLVLIIKATMALDLDISMRFCDVNQVPALNIYQIVWTKSIKTSADTYLDIDITAEKIEEDELKKFASYTKR